MADLAVGLPSHGYEVITCGPAAPVALNGHRDHVHLDLRRPVSRRDLRLVADLARILDRVRPDIVHAHSSKAGAVARLAKLPGRNARVLYTPHGFAFAGHFRFRAERRAYRAVEQGLGRLTDRVVCVCQAEARLARLVIAPDRVRVVYNGVPDRGEGPATAAIESLARRGPVISALGLMRAGKGFETLIDAMPDVIAQHPLAQVAIWGDGPEQPALRERARMLGLTETIHFLGSAADPVAALRGSTVFAMPSWRESFPYVVLEAMSAGVPVVASDVGGVREAIADGRHGLLVAPQDPAALAGALARALADEELRARLGAAGRHRVATEFSQPKMLSRLHEVYTEILDFGRF